MKNKAPDMSVFDMVMAGLEDSIAFSKGEKMSLVTVQVPAPPPPMGAQEVSEIRARLRMSQGVFAAALNVSPKTVQGWEQGLRAPSNASLRLLQIAREDPQVVLKAVHGKAATNSPMKERSTNARKRKTNTSSYQDKG